MNEDSSVNNIRSVTRGSTLEIVDKNQSVKELPLIIKSDNTPHLSGEKHEVERQHVHIVDRPCGTGKTTSILNSFKPDQKYLVVVPLLSEVERVIRDAKVSFYQPKDEETTKLDDLHQLLRQGVNVVTTHVLYADIAVASNYGLLDDYNIIIDEVLDVVESVQGVSATSFNEIYVGAGYAVEAPNGLIIPTAKWDEQHELVSKELQLGLYRRARSQTLYRVDEKFFLWALPPSLLKSGKSITVYTYMAEGSLMLAYLRKIGISYSHERYDDDLLFRLKARSLISVKGISAIEKAKLKFSYTKQTESKQKDSREKKVSGALKSLKLRQLSGVAMADVLITCAKQNWFWNGDDKSDKPQAFSKGSRMFGANWIANTTRGTNDFAHCSVCIYLYDQYLNPYVKRWLGLAGDPGADDRYALTELIQWVYRSRVRRGLPITLYIPSKRMRGLFQAWLDGENIEEDYSPLPLAA